MVARASAFLALLIALQASAIEPPREREKWLSVRADGIRIISNASPRATQELARDLLRMREAVAQVSRLRVRSPITTRIYLFASEPSFAPYRKALFENEHIAGAFLSRGDANVIMLRADSPSIDRVIFHELTHYFINNTVASLPLWAHEGLAEYYSTFRSTKESVDIGLPVKEHVGWLRREPLIPLRELFSVTHDSPVYNEGRRTGVFYAQTWVLVHYFMIGGDERRAQFAQFLQRTNDGEPLDDAFKASFGITYAQLEQELRLYVRKFTMKYKKYALDELKIAEPPAPEVLSRDAVLYELGRLVTALGTDHADNAAEFFEAALQENPRHAGALASRAKLHQQSGRMKEAETLFARAAEIGSDDADVLIAMGYGLIERSAPPPHAEVLKARAFFTKATQLEPDSARAWLGFAISHLEGEDDLAPGIAAALRAKVLAPSDDNAPQVLAQLRERQQVRDINVAIDTANSGKYAEALAKLDHIIPTITDKTMLQNARKLRDDIAKHVKR